MTKTLMNARCRQIVSWVMIASFMCSTNTAFAAEIHSHARAGAAGPGWNAVLPPAKLDDGQRHLRVRHERGQLRNPVFFIQDGSAIDGANRAVENGNRAANHINQGLNTAASTHKHNVNRQNNLYIPRGLQIRDVFSPQAVQLDLSSNAHGITATEGMLRNKDSITITEGGTSKTFHVGDKLTAAEYIAVQQQAKGDQTILLDDSGRASGGTLSLNSLSTKGNSLQVTQLVVPKAVTAIDNFSRRSDFSVSGDLTNYGTIVGVAKNLHNGTGTISANNIINGDGAVLSTVLSHAGRAGEGADDGLSLVLNATKDIANGGELSSAGSLTLIAGGTITNSGSNATVKAAQDVNIQSANLNNSGLIKSVAGNVSLGTNVNADVSVNNTGGTISAAQGAINIREANYAADHNTTVTGGDLLSTSLNLNSGDGTTNVNVNNLTGVVNGTGKAAHVTASTQNLQVGSIAFSGDPTFYNDAGDVTLNGDITVGETLSVIASGNVNSDANVIAGDNNTGYDINLVAGANIINTNPVVTVDGPSSTGGNVNLTGGSLSTSSTATSGDHNAGNLTIVAYADGSGNNGDIDTTATTINTGAVGNGTSGNITVIGGGSQIQTGSMTTTVLGSSGGNVSIVAAQPTTSDGQTISFNTVGDISSGNSFVAGAASNGNIIASDIGALGNINVTAANGSVTIGSLYSATGNVSVSAGTGISSTASGISLHGYDVSASTNSGNIVTNGASFGVNATNDIYLHGDTRLDTSNDYAGGNVSLVAGGDIDLGTMDINTSGIIIDTDHNAPGGSVLISSGANSDQFVLRMHDIITSSSSGHGGDVIVEASTNQVFRVGTGGSVHAVETSGQSSAGDFTFRNSGSGGLEIVGSPLVNHSQDAQGANVAFETAGNINFTGGSYISTTNNTLTNGNGDISIIASSMSYSGGLMLDASAGASLGNTGNVTIQLGGNNITNNGDVFDSFSIAAGNNINLTDVGAINSAGGSIDLRANFDLLAGFINAAGISSNSNGGSVYLQALQGTLTVGDIVTSGIGSGNGGSVSILSDSSNPTTFGNINANGGLGDGGNVTIVGSNYEFATTDIQAKGGADGNGGQVSIFFGNAISAPVAGSIDVSGGRNGGSIDINSSSQTISFVGPITLNAASTDTSGTYANGNINIQGPFTLDGGNLTLSTYNPQALAGTGNITIVSPGSIETNGNTLTADASGTTEITSGYQQLNTAGGGVHIVGQQGVNLHDIQLNTSANGLGPDGGDVTIHSDNYITGILYINTMSDSGHGGAVDLASGSLLNFGYIQADGVTGGGDVSIHVVNADVSANITSRGGGSVDITGDNAFNVSVNAIDLSANSTFNGGNLFVDTNGGNLTINGETDVSGISNGGNIDLRTHNFAVGSFANLIADGHGGHGGNVSIVVTGSNDLNLGSGSGTFTVSATGNGMGGDGGNVSLATGGNISINGPAISVIGNHGTDFGDTGNMTFFAVGSFSSSAALNLFNSGYPSGTGDGGNLTITADGVSLAGVYTSAGNGNGGNVTINAGAGGFSNSSVIYTGGGQSGNGGNVSITASSAAPISLGQIATNSGSSGSSSGNVSIVNNGNGFANGGIILTDGISGNGINTQSNVGNAGNIVLSAVGAVGGQVSFEGTGSNLIAAYGGGASGDVLIAGSNAVINNSQLDIYGGNLIVALSDGGIVANGQGLYLQASHQIDISLGNATIDASDITIQATNVNVQGNLNLNSSNSISVATTGETITNGGNFTATAGADLSISGTLRTSDANNGGNVTLSAAGTVTVGNVWSQGSGSSGGNVSILAGSDVTANELHTNGLASANSGNLSIVAGGNVVAYILDTSSQNMNGGAMTINASQLAVTAPIPVVALDTSAQFGKAGDVTINLTSANTFNFGHPNTGNGVGRMEFFAHDGANIVITASAIEFFADLYNQGHNGSVTLNATTGDITMNTSTTLHADSLALNTAAGDINLSGLIEGHNSITLNSHGSINQLIDGSQMLAGPGGVITLWSQTGNGTGDIGSAAQRIRIGGTNFIFGAQTQGNVYIESNDSFAFGTGIAGAGASNVFDVRTRGGSNASITTQGTQVGGTVILTADGSGSINNGGGFEDTNTLILTSGTGNITVATSAANLTANTAGNVNVTDTGNVSLNASSGDTFNLTSQGNLTVDGSVAARHLTLQTTGANSNIVVNTNLSAVNAANGDGGDIAIIATGDISFASTTVNANGVGNGNGGTVIVYGDSISISGGGHGGFGADGSGTGNGGLVQLETTSATADMYIGTNPGFFPVVARSGEISGNGGTLTLTSARDIIFTGADFTVDARGSEGNGGNFNFNAGRTLGFAVAGNVNGAGNGNGGNINIVADYTGWPGLSANGSGIGNGGNINITVGNGGIDPGTGYISANGGSSGNGGTILVTAHDINPFLVPSISAIGGSGSGGSITIDSTGPSTNINGNIAATSDISVTTTGNLNIGSSMSATTISLVSQGTIAQSNPAALLSTDTLDMTTSGASIGTDTANILTNAANLHATTTNVSGMGSVYVVDNNNAGVSLFGSNVAGSFGGKFFLSATGSTGNITTAPGGSVNAGVMVINTDNGSIGQMPVSATDWSNAFEAAAGPGTGRVFSAANGNVYVHSDTDNLLDSTVDGVTYTNIAGGDFFLKADGYIAQDPGSVVTANKILFKAFGNIAQDIYGSAALTVNLVGSDKYLTVNSGGGISIFSGVSNINSLSAVNLKSQLGIDNGDAGLFSPGSYTLTAAGAVDITDPISSSDIQISTTNNGNLSLSTNLTAGNNLVLNASGAITSNSNVTVNALAGNMTFQAHNVDSNGNLTLNAAGNLTLATTAGDIVTNGNSFVANAGSNLTISGAILTSDSNNGGNISLLASGGSVVIGDVWAQGSGSSGGNVSIFAAGNVTANEIHTNGLASANSGNLSIAAGGNVVAYILDTSSQNMNGGAMTINASQLAVTAPIPVVALDTSAQFGKAGDVTINLTSANTFNFGHPNTGNGVGRMEFFAHDGANIVITASAIEFFADLYNQGHNGSVTLNATAGDITMNTSTTLHADNLALNTAAGDINLSGLIEGHNSITLNSHGSINQLIDGSQMLAGPGGVITLWSQTGNGTGDIGSAAQRIRIGGTNFIFGAQTQGNVYIESNDSFAFGTGIAGAGASNVFDVRTRGGSNASITTQGTQVGGTVILTADGSGSINNGGGFEDTNTLILTSGSGNITVATSAANLTANTAGNVNVTETGNVSLNASSGDTFVLTSVGNMTVNGPLTAGHMNLQTTGANSNVVVNTNLSAVNAANGDGGDIAIIATGDISFASTTVNANGVGNGNGGTVIVYGDSISISGGGHGGFGADGSGTGNGGLVQLETTSATADMYIGTNPGFFPVVARSGELSGNGGTLTLTSARDIIFTGADFTVDARGSEGNGGNFNFNAGRTLGFAVAGNVNGAGNGNGGNINIVADYTGWPGLSANGSGTGNGGNINISVGNGGIDPGTGYISANGGSSGNGGNILITAHDINPFIVPTISANSGSGVGGSITIDSTGPSVNINGSLVANSGQIDINATGNIHANGIISVAGLGNGNGGNITVAGESISLVGANADGAGTGNGGIIDINTQSGGVQFAGNMSAIGLNGGQINISTTGALLFSGASELNVGASDNTFSHPIGDINITAGDINMTGGPVNMYAYNPLALFNTGNVHITTTSGNLVTNGNNFLITAYGGIDINLAGGVLDASGVSAGEVRLLGHTVTDLHGATINASSTGVDNGGNAVFVQAGYVYLGDVIANGVGTGNGGALLISAFITNVGNVSLDGGTAGNGGYMDLQSYGGISALSFSAQGGVNGGTLGFGNPGAYGTHVTGAINVSGGNTGGSILFGNGPGGIETGDLIATGGNHGGTIVANTSGIMSFSNANAGATGSGDGGNITINATGDISIASGIVSVAGSGNGNGGNIIVKGNSVAIVGGGHGQFLADGSGIGNGGLIDLQTTSATADLYIGTNPGYFSVVARSGQTSGNGGTLTLTSARDLIFTGADFTVDTRGSEGNGGNMNFVAGRTLGFAVAGNVNGAGNGNGGNINIVADYTGWPGLSANGSGTGNGGNINITVGNGGIDPGTGYISANGGSSGNGGTILVTAHDINTFNVPTISAVGGSGAGGSITVDSTSPLTSINGNITSTGDISLVAHEGTLSVSNGVVLSTANANVLVQNTDTNGSISLGSNVQINTNATDSAFGKIYVVIGGIPGSPVAGTADNVVQNQLNGGQIYLGDDVSASPPDNIITANGGTVIFSTDGQAGSILFGGGVLINALAPGSQQTLLTSLDLTDPTVVTLIQQLQSQGYVGGTLISDMNGVAIGGNAIFDSSDLSSVLTAEYIPQSVTLSFDGFLSSNPLAISLSAASTTTQVIIGGTQEFIGASASQAFLNITSNQAGPVLVITTTGALTSNGTLNVSASDSIVIDGTITAANTATINTTNGGGLNLGGSIVAGNVVVNAAGAFTSSGATSVVALTGDIAATSTNVNLNGDLALSASGNIAMTTTGGNIVTNGNAFNVNAGNDVVIAGGTLDSSNSNSGGNVSISAGGSISANDITAIGYGTIGGNISLTAGSNINAGTLTTIGFNTADSGNIAINAGGNVVVAGLDSSSQYMDAGNIVVNANQLAVTSTVQSSSISVYTAAQDGKAGDLTINLASSAPFIIGGGGSSGNGIEGTLNFIAPIGANVLIQAGGIALNESINNNGSNGTITLVASNGDIVNNNGSVLSTNSVVLSASGNVGGSGQSMVTDASYLTSSAGGSSYIYSNREVTLLNQGAFYNIASDVWGLASNDNIYQGDGSSISANHVVLWSNSGQIGAEAHPIYVGALSYHGEVTLTAAAHNTVTIFSTTVGPIALAQFENGVYQLTGNGGGDITNNTVSGLWALATNGHIVQGDSSSITAPAISLWSNADNIGDVGQPILVNGVNGNVNLTVAANQSANVYSASNVTLVDFLDGLNYMTGSGVGSGDITNNTGFHDYTITSAGSIDVQADINVGVSFAHPTVTLQANGDINLGANINSRGGVNLMSSAGSILQSNASTQINTGTLLMVAENGSIGMLGATPVAINIASNSNVVPINLTASAANGVNISSSRDVRLTTGAGGETNHASFGSYVLEALGRTIQTDGSGNGGVITSAPSCDIKMTAANVVLNGTDLILAAGNTFITGGSVTVDGTLRGSNVLVETASLTNNGTIFAGGIVVVDNSSGSLSIVNGSGSQWGYAGNDIRLSLSSTGDTNITSMFNGSSNVYTNGMDLLVVSGGNIIYSDSVNDGAINTSSGGTGGMVTFVAGADYTLSTESIPNQANYFITINGASATGGNIDLTGGADHGLTSINSSGSNGGAQSLTAFSGSTNAGDISLPAAGIITGGSISINAAGALTTSGAVAMTAFTGDLTTQSTNVNLNGDLTLSASGNIAISTSAGDVVTNANNFSASAGNNIAITGGALVTSDFSGNNGGNVSLAAGGSLNAGDILAVGTGNTGGNISLSAGSTINAGYVQTVGLGTADAGDININAGGDVVVTALNSSSQYQYGGDIVVIANQLAVVGTVPSSPISIYTAAQNFKAGDLTINLASASTFTIGGGGGSGNGVNGTLDFTAPIGSHVSITAGGININEDIANNGSGGTFTLISGAGGINIGGSLSASAITMNTQGAITQSNSGAQLATNTLDMTTSGAYIGSETANIVTNAANLHATTSVQFGTGAVYVRDTNGGGVSLFGSNWAGSSVANGIFFLNANGNINTAPGGTISAATAVINSQFGNIGQMPSSGSDWSNALQIASTGTSRVLSAANGSVYANSTNSTNFVDVVLNGVTYTNNAGGDYFLNDAGNHMTAGFYWGGGTITANNVLLKSAGNITQVLNGGGAIPINLVGPNHNLTVNAAGNAIISSASFVNLRNQLGIANAAGGGGTFTLTTSGSSNINVVNNVSSSGDVNLNAGGAIALASAATVSGTNAVTLVANGGSITQADATASIATQALVLQASGSVGSNAQNITTNASSISASASLGAGAGVWLKDTRNGAVTLAGTNSGGTYKLNMSNANGSIVINSGNNVVANTLIDLTTSALTLTGTLNAGSGQVSLHSEAGEGIFVGGTSAGQLSLTNAMLQRITAATLNIGDLANNNVVTVGGAVTIPIGVPGTTAGVYDLYLSSGGSINGTAGTITTSTGRTVSLTANGNITTGTISGGALVKAVSNNGNLTVDGSLTSAAVQLESHASNGLLTVNAGKTVTAPSITTFSNNLTINGAFNAGTGTVYLHSWGHGIAVGGTTGPAGSMLITTADLDAITADTVQIGGTLADPTVTINAAVNVSGSRGTTAGAFNLSMIAIGAYTGTGQTITSGANTVAIGALGTVNTGTITATTGNISAASGTNQTLTVDGNLTNTGSAASIVLYSQGNMVVNNSVTSDTVTLQTANNGSVTIGATVGKSTGTTNIIANGTGAINDAGAGSYVIQGTDVNLTSGSGAIGSTALRTAAHNLTVNTGGSSNIDNSAVTGTLTLFASNVGGSLSVLGGGDIKTSALITANNLTLTGGTNGAIIVNSTIGSVTGTTTLNATGTGTITDNTNGLVRGALVSLNSNTGNINIHTLSPSIRTSTLTSANSTIDNTAYTSTADLGTSSVAGTLTFTAGGALTTSGNVAANVITLKGATNANITVGGTLGSVTGTTNVTAYGTGNINTSGTGLIRGNSVVIKAATGTIGTTALKTSAANLEVDSNGNANIDNTAMTSATVLNASDVAGIFQILTGGNVSNNGLVTAANLTLTTTNNGNITIGANFGSTTGNTSLIAGGSGTINLAGSSGTYTVRGDSLTLTTSTGAIGSTTALRTTANSMTITTGGTASANVTNSGGMILNNSLIGGGITLVSNGPFNINNLSTSNGSINLIATGSSLTVNNNAQLYAGNGNILIQNQSASAGTIVIGNSANIYASSTTPGLGNVTIAVGTVPSSPVLGPTPANVSITRTGSGQVYFGTNGITTSGPVNNLLALDRNIVFSTGTRPASAIKINGNVTITADPPADLAALLASRAAGGTVTTTAPTTVADVATITPTSQTTLIQDPRSVANFGPTVSQTPTILNASVLQLPSVSTTSLQSSTLQSNASADLTNTAVNTALPVGLAEALKNGSNVYTLDEETGTWSQPQLDNAQSTNSIACMVAADETMGLEEETIHGGNLQTTIEKVDGKNIKRTVLKEGNVLFVPFTDTIVETEIGNITLAAKSVTLVMASHDKVSVFDIHDAHKASVVVSFGKERLSLCPGNQVVLTRNNAPHFELVNPIEAIGYRHVHSRKLHSGVQLFASEFSIPSAISSIAPLQKMVASKHPVASRTSKQLLKTAAVVLQLGGAEYQTMVAPKMSAMK